MAIKFFLAGLLSLGLFFGGYNFATAESEGGEDQESETESETGGGGEGGGGESGGEAAGAAEGGAAAAGSVVPGEVQQQLDSVQKTIDTAQSVKEKGLLSTIWDSITAPIAAIFNEIGRMFGQILSLFGG